ncbi:protein of unknown function [Nitrospira japonica]|uniref:Uncharacterized protein n=1 Tax=Nitrospira japonica TaxID=1325564 RepID=A0A1W1I9Y8_9BACT|nr:protein of unknown function [Nitrospira japonica]
MLTAVQAASGSALAVGILVSPGSDRTAARMHPKVSLFSIRAPLVVNHVVQTGEEDCLGRVLGPRKFHNGFRSRPRPKPSDLHLTLRP